MVTVKEALELVEANIKVGDITKTNLISSLNSFNAKEVCSPIDMPPFPQSAMDGYAVNFDSEIKTYKLIGEIAAGSSQLFTINVGEAVRIFTGAAVPDSATTVVKQEDVIVNGNEISFSTEIQQAKNIRPQAEQIKKNEVALPVGQQINAGIIGFLATIGLTEIDIYNKPKVAILTTGDELIKPGQKLEYGKIFESNSSMLEAALRAYGISQIEHIKIPDEYQATVTAIQKVSDTHDFVLLSGGISVGDYDFVGKALKEVGVKEVFYKVKQKPGKPLYFGTKEQTNFFALPGNPAAALSLFYVYVLPAINKFQGGDFTGCARMNLPLNHDYERKIARDGFLKGRVENTKIEILGAQSSAMLSSFSQANCLVYIPANTEKIKAGDLVEVLLF